MRPAGRITAPTPPSPTPSPSAATPSPSNVVNFDEKKTGETGSTSTGENTGVDFTTPTRTGNPLHGTGSPGSRTGPYSSTDQNIPGSNIPRFDLGSTFGLGGIQQEPQGTTSNMNKNTSAQRPSSGVFNDSFFRPSPEGSTKPRTETNLSTNESLPGSSIPRFNLDSIGMEAIQEEPRGTAFDMESKEDRVNHAKSRLEAYAGQVAAILSRRAKPDAPTDAMQFDNLISQPTKRTTEDIEKNIDFARNYTGMMQEVIGPYSPITFTTVIAEDSTKTPENLDNINIKDYLAIETTYTPGKGQSSMSVGYSANERRL